MTFGGARPVTLQVPPNFDASKSYPLTIILHGYGANGFVQESYFDAKQLVTANDTLMLAPDGTTDTTGAQFWNADPECCDFYHANPDDVGYIGGLIDEVRAAWPVDEKAISLIGHSNGGYMAYRMACERADVVRSIVVLAGNAATVPSTCTPSGAVDVLHLHGTADTEVPYAATAMRSVQQWAGLDACGTTFSAGASYDIDVSIPGMETTSQIADGCPSGVDVELWSIAGAGHLPNLDATFAPQVWTWLSAHRR